MTTANLIDWLMKSSAIVWISEKQNLWLIFQANRENIELVFDGSADYIYFDSCFYRISNCKRWTSGGSYGFKKNIQGRYNLERFYKVQFSDTKIVQMYGQHQLEELALSNFKFEIINPKN